MSRGFGSRHWKRKAKRLLEQLLLLMSVVRHRTAWTWRSSTNETKMERKNRRKEKSNTSEELRKRRNRATVNDADRVLEMERDREWAMRRMKEGRERGCGGAGSRRTRLYTGNPPLVAGVPIDRTAFARPCSSLPLPPTTIPYSFWQRVRDSLSNTHPSSTFSLYISLSSLHSSVQAREERLPSATRLASRDTRITTVMFC